jgi:hypothetical protein
MCVNKRREPTTDTQLTRRGTRNPNVRIRVGAGRVVRRLREIVALDQAFRARPDPIGVVEELARIFPSSGIFGAGRASYSLGIGGGIGHRSRMPHLGSVKERKPGSR